MLSKSAARAFFLVGTLLCGGAFIILTVDTLSRVPEQTREAELTPAVVRGKILWEENNCMGCHTLFGEGAYYAPELTKVYERRGPMFIRQMINDAQSMYPGQRKMVDYDFSEEELDDLVEFFKWCGNVDLNGFPPKPTITAAAGAGPVVDARPATFKQVCAACHAVGGAGGQVGPALDGIADRMKPQELTKWLKDPTSVKPDSKMPQLPLSDSEISELVQYLSTLESEAPQ